MMTTRFPAVAVSVREGVSSGIYFDIICIVMYDGIDADGNRAKLFDEG